jgi:anaerobic ribonucleoside-triphosphate reductase
MPPTTIIKRNGEAVPFDTEKITVAIYKAMAAGGAHDRELAEGLTRLVVAALDAAYSGEQLPTVEDTQDFVERVLIQGGHTEVAKRYILYRGERA